jgi:hypothetical protein
MSAAIMLLKELGRAGGMFLATFNKRPSKYKYSWNSGNSAVKL